MTIIYSHCLILQSPGPVKHSVCRHFEKRSTNKDYHYILTAQKLKIFFLSVNSSIQNPFSHLREEVNVIGMKSVALPGNLPENKVLMTL